LESLAHPDAITVGKLLEKWADYPKFVTDSRASLDSVL
jgi:hypothetical protein